MGHKDIQTTMDIYAEATEEKKQETFEGKITMKEAQSLIDSYYEEGPVHLSDDERTEEADKVSSRIVEILSETAFSFLRMSILPSTVNYFRGFINTPERFEITTLQRRMGS